MPQPTLRQIAEACGVNVSTVSRALNGHHKVSASRREAVLKQARKMGWSPNPLASTYMAHLRSTREPSHRANLAFVNAFSDITRWKDMPGFAQQVYEGASNRAQSLGYSLDTIWLHELGGKYSRLSSILKSRGVLGAILHRGNLAGNPFAEFSWNDFAVATYGFGLLNPLIHRATHHQGHGMKQALDRIYSLGYTRPALVLDSMQVEVSDHASVSAYCYQQLQRGTPLLYHIYENDDPEHREGIRTMLLETRPDVVIGDQSVWQTLELMKWRVPQDVAFVSPFWHIDWPTIAGVDQLPHVVGTNALDLVAGQVLRNERGIPAIPKLLSNEGVWRDGPSLPPAQAARRRRRRK